MTDSYTLQTVDGHHIAHGPLSLVAAQAAQLHNIGPLEIHDGHNIARFDTCGLRWVEPQELFPESHKRAAPNWVLRLNNLLAEFGENPERNPTP